MNETKFTPGPWIVSGRDGSWRLDTPKGCIMCDEQYYPWTPDKPEDWNLIAAAPDLYAALKDLLEATSPREECDELCTPIDCPWKAAQAALAKAVQP